MVDFIKVKINRLSDPVILQHLWNSIDDINLCGLPAKKCSVIEKCENVYGVEQVEINKNLFLALKEGTITRSIKTDILSRCMNKEDRLHGDWYCFLCHKSGPDTRCQKCDTSFHSNCNSDLFDQFHCHTCRQFGQFISDFYKFSTTTQSQLIQRIIHCNKRKWKSLNIVGYLKDEARNRFFIYKTINSSDIDRKFANGKYFSDNNAKVENFLFDLLLLKHNCSVIYGIEHAFCKLISGYIKHLHMEIDTIYCDSCYILYTKSSNHKLSSAQKQDLFCNVCIIKHPVMWALVPPNVFWPFKVISHDSDKIYGIKFSGSIHFSRQKVESFAKETCLVWTSYNLQMCDRPSLDLLKAHSLAQKYAHNLSEAQKCPNNSQNFVHKKQILRIKINNRESPCKRTPKHSKIVKYRKIDLKNKNIENHRKVGRPPLKRKVGRPSLKNKMIIRPNINREMIDNLSSTDSSESVSRSYVKMSKTTKSILNSDTLINNNSNTVDKVRRKSRSLQTQSCIAKKNNSKYKKLSLSCSSSSESDCKYGSERNSYAESPPHESAIVRLDYTNHQPIKLSSSVYSSKSSSQLYSNHHQYSHNYKSSSSENEFEENDESFSSDATMPQKLESMEQHYQYKEFNRTHLNRKVSNAKHLNKYRSSLDLPMASSKYSASSPSSCRSSHYVANDLSTSKESLKMFLKENDQGLSQIFKDGFNSSRANTLETGLYCSSSSPINFSPISTNPHATVTQFSMQSTPSSSYPMSCDEIPHSVNSSCGNVKLNPNNRNFHLSSQFSGNVQPKVEKNCRIDPK